MGSSNQTTKTKSEPWKVAQPYLKQGLRSAGSLFGSLDPNRYMDEMQGALNPASQVASGEMGLSTIPDYRSLLNRAQQPNEAMGYLRPIAQGQSLQNPYFQQRLDDVLGRAAAAGNRSVSMAGRYGSGAHGGVLGDRLGQAATSALADDWTRERQNQMSAISQLGQLDLASLGAQQNALQGLTGAEQQGIANQLGAGSQLLSGYGALRGMPWDDVTRFNAIANAAGGLGGTQTSTQPGPSPLMQGLGTAMSIASFL